MQQENPSFLDSKTEAQNKADVITAYLEKFGAIENRVITSQTYAVYIEALSRFELRKIEKGLKTYLEQGERWPWPGTLAEFIEDEI